MQTTRDPIAETSGTRECYYNYISNKNQLKHTKQSLQGLQHPFRSTDKYYFLEHLLNLSFEIEKDVYV